MKKIIIFLLLLLIVMNTSVFAEDNQTWYERTLHKTKELASDISESSNKALEQTKVYSAEKLDELNKNTEDIAQKTKKLASEISDSTKEVYEDSKEYTDEVIHDIQTDDITFEAFYKESSSIGWIVVAVVTVISVVALVYSGGTATPLVSSIGTWLGSSFMGLNGIAATNAGLALLGGGSIASGGFGIIGGTVLLTGVLTFGTEIIVDYTVSKVIDEYSYSQFSENSKNMITLPLPKNTSGSESYENTISILEDIDNEIPISSELTQATILKAIKALKIKDAGIELDEKAKKESLFALLYFISNNYIEAKKHAKASISLAKEAKVKYTLPSYILATSALYDDIFKYSTLADNLEYSLLEEPENPIIPLLLSIHLDRMMYRFGDKMVDENSLNRVFTIVSTDSLKDLRLQNYIIVLSRYLIRLKLEQQKISSLAKTDNKTIKNSPKTLLSIKKSFESYKKLLIGSHSIIEALEQIKVEEDEKEIEAKKQINTFKELTVQYANDRTRLQGLIKDLERYQASLSVDENIQVNEVIDTEDKNIYLYIGLAIVFIVLIGFLITRRKEEV